MLATERDDSALLPGMFRLAVTGPDESEPTQLAINGPIALIGREESCACRLDHPNISRRHAYLQAIFGRIFCVDLGSRTGTHWGETARKSGWLDPDSPIRIGPYQIQMIDSIGLGQPSVPFPDNFSPLDPYVGQLGTLPRVELEILNGSVPSAEMTISRLITLVGSSPRCKLRLQHPSIAKVDCSLLWLPDGLWVVDVSGRGHSRLRGKILRCARLENEQTLRLGRFHLKVHYLSGAYPSAQPQGDIATIAKSLTNRGVSQRSSGEDALEVILGPAEDESNSSDGKNARGSASEPSQSASGENFQSLERERKQLSADREALNARERALDAREAKLGEAQGRLASAWEHLHVDRAAYEALAADLERQRAELANREFELAGFRQNLTFEWQKLAAEREAGFTGRPEPVAHSSAVAPDSGVWLPDSQGENYESQMEAAAPAPVEDGHPAGFDPLESVRHNKVFFADRTGTTLVVMPLGDAQEFHYGDVHVESNKVRRLLEAGTFKDLVVDFADAPVYSAVTINVVVALSRIASNRGGRAVMCRASEKTRGLLQTMRLLDVWPLFESREDAFVALSSSAQA